MKFNQIVEKILNETSLAAHPGGVFGSGPGSIVNDPNVLAAMAFSTPNHSAKMFRKKKKNNKKPLNKTL